MNSWLDALAGCLAWSTAPVDYAPLALTLLAALILAGLYWKLHRPPPPRSPG